MVSSKKFLISYLILHVLLRDLKASDSRKMWYLACFIFHIQIFFKNLFGKSSARIFRYCFEAVIAWVKSRHFDRRKQSCQQVLKEYYDVHVLKLHVYSFSTKSNLYNTLFVIFVIFIIRSIRIGLNARRT